MRTNASEAVGHSDPRAVQAGCEERTSILLDITQDLLKSGGAPLLTSKNSLSFHAASFLFVGFVWLVGFLKIQWIQLLEE